MLAAMFVELPSDTPPWFAEKARAWIEELEGALGERSLPLPAQAFANGDLGRWLLYVSWPREVTRDDVSVSASKWPDGRWRSMLAVRPREQDQAVLVSYRDPVFDDVGALCDALRKPLSTAPPEG